MTLKKVPDISNFWKWWSVQLGLLSGALGAAAAAYGATALISADLVKDVPKWFGVGITVGSAVVAFVGVYARRLAQPGLEEPPK